MNAWKKWISPPETSTNELSTQACSMIMIDGVPVQKYTSNQGFFIVEIDEAAYL
jgi:hypothetical protein